MHFLIVNNVLHFLIILSLLHIVDNTFITNGDGNQYLKGGVIPTYNDDHKNKYHIIYNIAVYLLGSFKSSSVFGMKKESMNDYFNRALASKLTWARHIQHFYYVTGTGPYESLVFQKKEFCENITMKDLIDHTISHEMYYCNTIRVLHFHQCTDESWGKIGPCCRCEMAMKFFLYSNKYYRKRGQSIHSLPYWFIFADDDYFMRIHFLQTILNHPVIRTSQLPYILIPTPGFINTPPRMGFDIYNRSCINPCVHRFQWMSWGGFSMAALRNLEPIFQYNHLQNICEAFFTTHDVGLGIFTWLLPTFPRIEIFHRSIMSDELAVLWHNPVRFDNSAFYDVLLVRIWFHGQSYFNNETASDPKQYSYDEMIETEKKFGEIYLQKILQNVHHNNYHILTSHHNNHQHTPTHFQIGIMNSFYFHRLLHYHNHKLPYDQFESLFHSLQQNPFISFQPISSNSRPYYYYDDCVEDYEYFLQWEKQNGFKWNRKDRNLTYEDFICREYSVSVAQLAHSLKRK